MTTKRCPACTRTLPAEKFGQDLRRVSGLYTYCLECAPTVHRRVAHNTILGRTSTGLVPAQAAREHVERLVLGGMSRHQIAELAGVDRTQVRNLLVGQPPRQGPAKRLRATTAKALMSVAFTPCEPTPRGVRGQRSGATIDNTGTRRRLEALMANGWPSKTLARHLGMRTANLQLPRYRRVLSSTALAVRDLYDALAETPGPSAWASTFYRAKGYLHPGWWDADTIDDPDAEPLGLREQVNAPKRSLVEVDLSRPWAEQVVALTRAGLSDEQIAQRLRTSTKQVRRARAAA